MNDRPVSVRDTTLLGRGRFLRLVERNGWEYVERARGTGVVAIVAVTDDGRLLLTEQYRPAVDAPVIDLPAGLVGDEDGATDEDLETAAARELREETGYEARSWKVITTSPTSPGLTSETVTLFLAEHLDRTGDGGGEATEAITVHTVSLAELPTWLQNQSDTLRLIDPKVYAGLWLREHACRH